MKRSWVWISMMVLAAAWPWVGAQQPEAKGGKRLFLIDVHEKAGIRRGGYPACATFTLEKPLRDAKEAARFRLRDGGKVIPADFFTIDDGRQQVRVCFHSSHAPFETRTYA